jgi:hypothetical protein
VKKEMTSKSLFRNKRKRKKKELLDLLPGQTCDTKMKQEKHTAAITTQPGRLQSRILQVWKCCQLEQPGQVKEKKTESQKLLNLTFSCRASLALSQCRAMALALLQSSLKI